MQKVILDVSASSVYALLTMKALPNGGVMVLFVLKDLLDEIKLPTASSSNSTTSFGFGYDGFWVARSELPRTGSFPTAM